jgi:hypothetical protein
MKRISSIVGGTIAAAAVGALLAPAAGAATLNHEGSKGTLRVCVVGIGERMADVEADGPTDRKADLENKECATWVVTKGAYTVTQDETDDNQVARTFVRGPGRSWKTSGDNAVKVQVRRGSTTTVVFFDKRERDRFQGFGCFWCGEH